jgi:hemerythrin superfamily protein
MKKNHDELVSLVESLSVEHTAILGWVDKINNEISQKKSSEEISEMVTDFKQFLLEHILKEDDDFYPNLYSSKEVDSEMVKLHDIYHDLEGFFNSTEGEIVTKFQDVASKITSRINYEKNTFKKLLDDYN